VNKILFDQVMPLHFRFVVICFSVFFWFSGQGNACAASAVVSAHPLATEAGERILENGGNAFDAAIAVSAALAVVEPYASGLGGGGFWLLHHAQTNRSVMIDSRETAPSEASSDMFLDEAGQPVPGKSLDGPMAAGIPGTPAALVHLSRYGLLTLADSLAPAIQLAREGFQADRRFVQTLRNHEKKLSRYPDTAAVFLPGGKLLAEGELFRQPRLAATLTAIAQSGKNGFYQGATARELVRSVRAAGGLWREQDLENYRIIEREPVQFSYRNAQITSASLPSAGGLTLAQALNILETVLNGKQDEIQKDHLIVEALRLAYKDRAELLGDSDFVAVPTDRLISRAYARQQAATINPDKAGVSQAAPPSPPAQHLPAEGVQTTHFAVLDKTGNRVAATLTINTFFGSGFVAGNTGVLLNNEMDDFAIGKNIPNVFGLYGSRANAIAPGKRPLSSMSPTFVDTERGVLIAGTPGGSRIISMLLLVILDYIDNVETDPQKLAARPRFHHQYLPDVLQIEPDAFGAEWISALRAMGHEVQAMPRSWGNMQLIHFDRQSQTATTANDPRGRSDTRY
jgi:gamma-glutamyltranspeptidase / glutathione hydrolase